MPNNPHELLTSLFSRLKTNYRDAKYVKTILLVFYKRYFDNIKTSFTLTYFTPQSTH